jgi:hypothetical protein
MTEKPTNLNENSFRLLREVIEYAGKTCNKCEEEKPFSEFRRRLISKDGFRSSCRSCMNASDKLYRVSHKEERQSYSDSHKNEQRAYRDTHKGKQQAYQTLYRVSHKEERQFYRDTHREELSKSRRIYHRKKRDDPVYRLSRSISSLIYGGFKKAGSSKNKRQSLEILGCSFEYFSTYIGNQFKEGMTLGNYGEWELDHIVPQSLAVTVEDVTALNHYSNFQPLFKADNIRKSNKLIPHMISPENKIRYKEIIERAQKQRSR